MTIKVPIKINNFFSNTMGTKINSPEQRLIQGITALGLQPMFDLNNKDADQETRIVSVSRTIGKIIAGTTVGVLVRYGCIDAVNKYSNYILEETEDKLVKSIKQASKKDIFVPTISYSEPHIKVEDFKIYHKNHIKALGTIVATFTMVATNFLIDAPLTKIITNKLIPIVRQYVKKQEEKNASC